jgi:hypothetical protein
MLPGVSNVLAQQIEWLDDVHWRRMVYIQNPARQLPEVIEPSASTSSSISPVSNVALQYRIPNADQLTRVKSWIERYLILFYSFFFFFY